MEAPCEPQLKKSKGGRKPLQLTPEERKQRSEERKRRHRETEKNRRLRFDAALEGMRLLLNLDPKEERATIMEQSFNKLQGYMQAAAASPSSHQSAHGPSSTTSVSSLTTEQITRCPFATETDIASAQSLLSLAGQPPAADVDLATTQLLAFGEQNLDSGSHRSVSGSTLTSTEREGNQGHTGTPEQVQPDYASYAREILHSMDDHRGMSDLKVTNCPVSQADASSEGEVSDLSALEEAIAVDPLMLSLLSQSHTSLHSPNLPASTMIILLDLTNPQLVDCNQAALDRMQAPSIGFAKAFNPMCKLHLDVPILIRAREALLSGRARQAHAVRRIRRPDGQGVIWMETMLTCLNNPDRPGLVLGVAQPASAPLDGRARVQINGETHYNDDPYASLDKLPNNGCINGLCSESKQCAGSTSMEE
eukprot:m.38996 g.38996  ORF g.38996 m.38996 type:complete len:421 (+) comp12628_c0_seq1:106-1368(+)